VVDPRRRTSLARDGRAHALNRSHRLNSPSVTLNRTISRRRHVRGSGRRRPELVGVPSTVGEVVQSIPNRRRASGPSSPSPVLLLMGGSSNGGSSSEQMLPRFPLVICDCCNFRRVKHYVSKTEDNYLRHFYKCPNHGVCALCSYFLFLSG
jgi:hypothetical protein